MRQEVINIYKFDELPPEAQAKVIEKWTEQNYEEQFFWANEALEAIKKGLDAFSCDLRDYSIDWSNPNGSYFKIRYPENAEELRGNRLRTWLINNADTGTFTGPKKYRKIAKKRESRIIKVESSCPFTGVCYDESFLDPIRKFIAHPDGRDLTDLMQGACRAVNKDTESEIDYQNTDAAIIETIQANDYEFDENGEMI